MSRSASNGFLKKFSMYMDLYRNMDRETRSLFERHVLIGLLTEEITGNSQDLGAATTKEQLLESLSFYKSKEFKLSLEILKDKSSLNCIEKASADLLTCLIKGDLESRPVLNKKIFHARNETRNNCLKGQMTTLKNGKVVPVDADELYELDNGKLLELLYLSLHRFLYEKVQDSKYEIDLAPGDAEQPTIVLEGYPNEALKALEGTSKKFHNVFVKWGKWKECN